MDFITTLITSIDTQVNHYTFDVYHSVMATMSFTLTILLVIYFAGLGWLVIRGLIPLTPLAIAWHVLKACAIFVLATRWDYFSFFIVNVFVHGPDRLIGALLSHTAAPGAVATTATITNSIAHLWQTGNNVFADVWRISGNDFLVGTIFGFIGYAVVTGITALPLFYIMMSKVALSVLLVLAPFILPMYLWHNTQAIFNGWLKLLVKWALVPLFIYTFAGLYLSLVQNQIDSMAASAGMPSTAAISAFVLVGIIVIATFIQAAKMASELAQHISIHQRAAQPTQGIPGMVVKTWRERGGF